MSYCESLAWLLTDAAAASPRFAAAVGDGDTPLLTLAALIADGLDEVDPVVVERQVDFLAYLVGQKAGGTASPRRRIAALREVLAAEEGYRGDAADYDAPENSYLARALERRRGLPITLAVIYVAVARRLGWPLVPVDLPRHFVVRYRTPADVLVIDPFARGRLVGFERCVELSGMAFLGVAPEQLERWVHERLETEATVRSIVRRMLRNLEASFLRRENFPAVRNVLEKVLLLDPGATEELRNLGLMHHRLGDDERALACWRSYLTELPNAPDRSSLEAAIARLEEDTRGEER